MAEKLGMECKLYYADELLSETVTPALATWNEAENVKDPTLNLSTGEADKTTRKNKGFRATRATLKDGTIEFQMLWDPDDEAFAAIQAAWLGSDEIALAAMDDDITTAGSEGLAGNFSITNFTRAENLEEVVWASVTAKPSSFTQWYKVAGS